MKSHSNLMLCLSSVMLLLLLASCEKAYDLNDESPVTPSDSRNARMVVRTAAHVAGSSDVTDYVSYPVNVYVMDDEGKCVALQQIESASDELRIDIPEGTYDVCAVAGTDNYSIPTASSATKQTVLELKSGKGHGDLMTACSNVVMTQGEENRLTLQLQRKVMQVQGITLNNIPTDVTAVQFTISPLRKGLRLGGDYVDGTDSHTFSLTKQSNGTTWKSAASEYLLEARDNATFKVSLTNSEGTTSYSYASSEQLAANYKVNITGNFVDDEHITLSGTIKGTDWAGTVDVNFNFDATNVDGSGGSTVDPDDGDDSGELYGEAPEEGSYYEGCYVLRTVNNGHSTTVTLMSPTEVNKLQFSSSKDDDVKQASIQLAAESALESVAVEGVSGWRLPTQEEMEYVNENIDVINENIGFIGSGFTSITLKTGAYYCGYYFTSSDGNVYVYTLGSGEINTSPNTDRATYKVRGFATITFTE